MKKLLIFSAIICCATFVACKSSNKNIDLTQVQEKVDSTDQAQAEEQPKQDSPEELVAKAVDSLSAVGVVAGHYDNVVYFFKRGNDGYQKTIYGYDVVNKTNRNISLKGLVDGPEEYISAKDFAMIDNRIAVIMHDGGRCGSGGTLGNTRVFVCDVKSGSKRDIVPGGDGCADAKFISNKTKINLSIGEITNEDEDVCAADYEYAFHDQVISF